LIVVPPNVDIPKPPIGATGRVKSQYELDGVWYSIHKTTGAIPGRRADVIVDTTIPPAESSDLFAPHTQAIGGTLTPEIYEWMMGWPVGHLEIVDGQTFGFKSAQECFQGELRAREWARSKNLTVTTGCHKILES